MADKKTLQKTYRLLIEAVYAKWNAEKFDDVPKLMEKYEDQEGEIYDRIVRKYVFCRPQKDWQPLVEAMYARFNPSKLTSLESIFEKYTDSEAALYRALCDKYLPTMEEHSSLLFNVWGQGGQNGAVQEEDASADEADEEAPMQLASPSQEEAPEHEEAPMQLASPTQASPSQEQVPEQSTAENVQEAAEDAQAPPALAAASVSSRELQPGAGDEPLPAAVAAKEGRKRKRRVQSAEDGSKVVDHDRGERKRPRGETVHGGGDDRPEAVSADTRVDAPASAVYPPPLPRRRKKEREAQLGAGDLAPAPKPDDFWQPQPAEPRMSKEESSRQVDATTRPKAASRPPDATCFEHDTEATIQPQSGVVVRRRRVKVADAQNSGTAVDGKESGRRRKRRRRVPAAAAEAVAATAHDATEQVPLASQQAPVPVLDADRMQQLKQKLTALKTQLSQQTRLRPEQRENTESGTYSDYSDEEELQQGGQPGVQPAGNGMIHLRNAHEAELRKKLLQSTLRKATGNVEPM